MGEAVYLFSSDAAVVGAVVIKEGTQFLTRVTRKETASMFYTLVLDVKTVAADLLSSSRLLVGEKKETCKTIKVGVCVAFVAAVCMYLRLRI